VAAACYAKPMRILLVDDDPGMQECTASILRSAGFEIEQEGNGDEALQHYLERGPCDLVLTDFRHPGMDGIELAAAIRRKSPMQPIALVSASAADLAPLPPALRDVPILVKPFRPQDLLELVRSMLKLSPAASSR